MERIPNGIYALEFRAEVVERVERMAKPLSMPISSLGNWVRVLREGKWAEVAQGQRLPSEWGMELVWTRKALAEVKLERDLLKTFRRVSRRSRGEIRLDRRTATRAFYGD